MPSYAEFRVRIERGTTSRSYRVVASGPGAEASGRMLLPFSEQDLEVFILRLGRTRRGVRKVNSPEMDQARTFGTQLFDAVFDGDVRELYRSAQAEANEAGQGLRVTLALTGAPELLQVPWEYLYDRPNFLSISTWTPIVRYLDLPRPPRPLQIAFPLRILGMVSAPSDAEPIDVEAEKSKLGTALAALVESGVVAIDWLENASLLALTRQLRKTDYHVFHYIGHGGFDAQAKDGVLLFEDEAGRSVQVGGAQLGDILHDEKSLRLAVLNACEGARTSIEDPFAGVATSLIEREIPAVIGMQFEITDRAAIVFASEFYSTLADGQPVDSAMSEARKSIYAMGNDIEWGTPVLFMRVQDGRLFDVQPHAPVPRPDPVAVAEAATPSAAPPEAVRTAETTEAAGAADTSEAAERDRLAAEAAERDRLAAEAAERDRLAAEAAERDRLAAEAAERDRLAAEAAQAAERERLAAEAAERERVVAEAVEQKRLAAEAAQAAERERLAAEAAERERVAAEIARLREAEAEAERDRRAAAETEALRQRLAALEAAQAVEARQREAAQQVAQPPAAAPQAPMSAWTQPAAQPAAASQAPMSAWMQRADPKAGTKRKSGFRWRYLIGIVLVIYVAALAVEALQGRVPGESGLLGATATPDQQFIEPTATVPDVRHLTEREAFDILLGAGFSDINSFLANLPCEGSVPAGLVLEVLDRSTESALTGLDVPLSRPMTVVVSNPVC